MLETIWVECPWCGEGFATTVDPTGGSAEYVEDCPVCCRPILFRVTIGAGALEAVTVERENE